MVESSSSEEEDAYSSGVDSSDEESNTSDIKSTIPCIDELYEVLQQSQFNWFHLVELVCPSPDAESELVKCYASLVSLSKSQVEKGLIEQSHQAFVADLNARQLANRQAEALNGNIVSDSESEDPDAYLGLKDLSSDRAQALIAAKRRQIQNKARYLKAKYIAQKNS